MRWVVGISLMLVFTTVAAAQPALSLDGVHRFRAGDDLAWAALEHDDRDWELQPVPGPMPDPWRIGQAPIGWYRLHFTMPPLPPGSRPAVALGVIVIADEVYLNGVKIGGEGRIGIGMVEAPWLERLYPLPPEYLRPGDNVLAVRVMNFYHGGFRTGPVVIGDYDVLNTERLARQQTTQYAEAIFLTIYLLCLLFLTWLYLSGMRRPEYWLLQLVILCYTAVFLFDTQLLYRGGWKTSMVERVYYGVCGIVLPLLLLWFRAVLQLSLRNRWLTGLVALELVVTLAVAAAPSFDILYCAVGIWNWLALLTTGLTLYWCVRAVWLRVPEAWLILASLLVGLVPHLLEFSGVGGWGSVLGVLTGHYGVVACILFAACALAVRFARTQRRLRALSTAILNAQEEERKRLARDMHDGVGQILLAVKLGLQMQAARERAGEPLHRDALDDMVQEMSQAIEELRRVALDLRPAVLEHLGLAEAIQWYCLKTGERTGIEVEMNLDHGLLLPVSASDHLYRIFQEGLKNAVEHAEARRVEVSLTRAGSRLRLQIRDDGRGFSPSPRTGVGVGLASIQERAELLGGVASIFSNTGRGTTVRIEIPYEPIEGSARV